jgi:hypothetical protein
LILATFKHVKPVLGQDKGGFNFPKSGEGTTVQYDIEVYKLPQIDNKMSY